MADLKIFTENIEHEALNQIYTLVKQPAFSDCKIRIMPDVHAGAGRTMSRSKAKESILLEEYQKAMDEIIGNIKDTVEIVDIIKPIYNFKANE